MEGMLGVAEYLDETNINVASTSAFRLYAILDQKMEQTKKPRVQEYKNMFGFRSTKTSKVAPEPSETYNGTLDSEKIAMDLIRRN